MKRPGPSKKASPRFAEVIEATCERRDNSIGEALFESSCAIAALGSVFEVLRSNNLLDPNVDAIVDRVYRFIWSSALRNGLNDGEIRAAVLALKKDCAEWKIK